VKSPPSKEEEAPPLPSRQTTAHPFRRQGTSANPFLHPPGRRFVAGELAHLAHHDRHRFDRTNVDRPWSGRSLLSRAPQLAARFVEIGHVLGGEFFTFVAHRQLLSDPSPVRTKSCPNQVLSDRGPSTAYSTYSTTLGTRKKWSWAAGAFLTISSAISPSVTTSGRFFMTMGVTEVIGSTPA